MLAELLINAYLLFGHSKDHVDSVLASHQVDLRDAGVVLLGRVRVDVVFEVTFAVVRLDNPAKLYIDVVTVEVRAKNGKLGSKVWLISFLYETLPPLLTSLIKLLERLDHNSCASRLRGVSVEFSIFFVKIAQQKAAKMDVTT